MAGIMTIGSYFGRRLEPPAGNDRALRMAFDALTNDLLAWTSARDFYTHWPTLLACCRAVVAERFDVPFAGRLTLAMVMAEGMVRLRKEHGLSAPGPWVQIIRELRAKPDGRCAGAPSWWERDDGVAEPAEPEIRQAGRLLLEIVKGVTHGWDHSMAEQKHPDWTVAQAKARWPSYQITGSGAFALVCPKTFAVALFDNATAGRIEAMTTHEPGCTFSHRRVLLHQPQPAVTRSPGAWERD